VAGGAQNRLTQSIDDLDRPLADPADIALFLQGLQVIGNAVGRGDLKLPADLRDRRGKTLFPNGLEQEIVDRFLPGSQRGKHESLYTEIIFSSQGAGKKRAVLKVQFLSLRT